MLEYQLLDVLAHARMKSILVETSIKYEEALPVFFAVPVFSVISCLCGGESGEFPRQPSRSTRYLVGVSARRARFIFIPDCSPEIILSRKGRLDVRGRTRRKGRQLLEGDLHVSKNTVDRYPPRYQGERGCRQSSL